MNPVLKIAIGIVLAIALVAGLVYAFGGCPESKPCSAKEQLLDLKAELRGAEKVREEANKAATDKAGDVANYVLATERLKAATADNEELKARIKDLERSTSGASRDSSRPADLKDYCDALSQADKEICRRTRPR